MTPLISLLLGSALASEVIITPFTEAPGPLTWQSRSWGMHTSADVANLLHVATTRSLMRGASALFPDNPDLARGMGLGWVYSSSVLLIFSDAWAHEEWHRAVLSQADVGSHNGVWHPSSWVDGLIPVFGVSDDDLAALGDDDPALSAWLAASGEALAHHQSERVRWERLGEPLGEGMVGLARDAQAPELQVSWATGLAYLLRCRSPSSVTLTERLESLQGDILERDFTGLDCSAWAYELTTPDESYNDRGVHPSGVGVDRYRHVDDLDEDGRALLGQALGLHLTGLLDPGLWGIRGFGDSSTRWLVAPSGEMTPHGTMLHLRVARDTERADVLMDLEQHFAGGGWRPGLQVAARRVPLVDGTTAFGEGGLRLQPQGLRWDAQASELGAWLQLGVRQRISQEWHVEGAAGGRNRVWIRSLPGLEGGMYGRLSLVWRPD